MPQINVNIAGRPYRMACAEGEEEHLQQLARQLDDKIGEMKRAFGEIGDQRLIVMAAITVSDELSEARRRIEKLEAEVASMDETRQAALNASDGWAGRLADALDTASVRIEALSQQMNAGGRKV
jgi:cell division protein ZapA